MSQNPGVLSRLLHGCAVGLLLLPASCGQLPPTSSVAIPPAPAGQARIWIYRNEGPYDSQDRPYFRLNGQVAGISEPNGALYRDVPPGHYMVSVDSYGVPYPNQFMQVELGAGQEVFIKVSSMRERVSGGDNVGSRALFFTYPLTADAARPAIAATPFYGSS